MFTMKTKHAVMIGLVAVALAGCSQPVANDPVAEPVGDADALATSPDMTTLAPSEDASAVLRASGGLAKWGGQKKLVARCIVKLYRPDGSFYLTEHELTVYPWSNAIRVSATEPRSKFVWELIDGQYALLVGDASLDVSPLAGSYEGYASAILEIVTAPVRFLDQRKQFHREATPERLGGQWYQRFTAKPSAKRIKEAGGSVMLQPYWTDLIYFMNRPDALVDVIWLGNTDRKEFLMVRGYDYSGMEEGEEGRLRVPSKIEIFRSDAEATIYERIAEINVKTDK